MVAILARAHVSILVLLILVIELDNVCLSIVVHCGIILHIGV